MDSNPRRAAHLPRGRSPAAIALVLLAAAGAISLTVWCTLRLEAVTLSAGLLLMLLEVVVVAALTDLVWAVAVALGAVLAANWFLVPPTRTLWVASTEDLILLVVFVFAAVLSSLSITAALRRTAAASRVLSEAAGLRETLTAPAGEVDPTSALRRLGTSQRLDDVRLLDAAGRTVASWKGSTPIGGDSLRRVELRLPDGYTLLATGEEVVGADPEALRSLAVVAVRAHQGRLLREQAEHADELARADRARSALLAVVGHDLRTPLAAIRLAAGTLQEAADQLSPQDRAALVETIVGYERSLTDLVTNLLDMSRLEAGRLLVSRAPTALDAVVAEATTSVATEVVAADLAIDVPEDLPLVDADAALLARVVANLVSNAVRHAQGAVTCRAAVRGEDDGGAAVDLLIIDHGPGLPLPLRDLAAPFQTTAVGDGGTGLGLAIASGFCQAMGAQLSSKTTPGGGTTMVVSLMTSDSGEAVADRRQVVGA